MEHSSRKCQGTQKIKKNQTCPAFITYWMNNQFQNIRSFTSTPMIFTIANTYTALTKLTCFVAQTVKNLPAMQETWVWSLGWDGPLEKGKATHSSVLAWRISQTEEPGRLQCMGSQRVGHDWGLTQYITLFVTTSRGRSSHCCHFIGEGLRTQRSLVTWR